MTDHEAKKLCKGRSGIAGMSGGKTDCYFLHFELKGDKHTYNNEFVHKRTQIAVLQQQQCTNMFGADRNADDTPLFLDNKQN